MGIFDFVKNQEPSKGFLGTSRILLKKFLGFKKKKTELEIESISFEDIKEFLSKKTQEIEEKQKEPVNQIKESLSELLNGLEEAMVILEDIDLKDKKAM